MKNSQILDWSLLSMRERAAYIRNAVAKGLSDVNDIRLDYNEFKKGGPTRTPVYEDFPAMLKKLGLEVLVTSGYRPNGAVGTAKFTHHSTGNAVDIKPIGNTTFEDIENAVYNNPAIRLYMLSHNLGLIDESGRTKESIATMKKTGATGAHFHIGKDSKYAALYRKKVGAMEPQGDRGKVVYFTNPFLPLEPEKKVELPRVILYPTPEEVLLTATIPEPIKINEDSKEIAANVLIPEIEVIGKRPSSIAEEILSLILENTAVKYEMPSYLIPNILDNVNLVSPLIPFLLKDLEDRIVAAQRRKQILGDWDDSAELDIANDIRQLLFLRNMSANGGPISNSDYYALMLKVAEQNNPIWNKQRAEEGLPLLSVDEEYLRILNDNSYDYRGYYNKYPLSLANASTHWTDEFKTAFHPTFSIESGYSGKKSQYNPNGYLGGVWLKNGLFVPTFWQLNMFEGGGLMPSINVPAVAKNLYNKAEETHLTGGYTIPVGLGIYGVTNL